MSTVLDGKTLAKRCEAGMAQRVSTLVEKTGRAPCLATLLVGDDPASATYVKMKGNACERIGMDSRKVLLDRSTTTQALLAEIEKLNRDAEVHGILLQHPVPPQIDERACFDAIAVEKDSDGVSCLGFGRLSMGLDAFGAATPAGIMRLLRHYRIELEGRHAVVVGRSPILGKPMAAMLLNANCTVTVCHSRTLNLADIVRSADLLVGAVGIPKFIQADWVQDNSVVVDAGYHPQEKCGDIDLEPLIDRVVAYTPVPGGVGPMTISTLIEQTLKAAERSH